MLGEHRIQRVIRIVVTMWNPVLVITFGFKYDGFKKQSRAEFEADHMIQIVKSIMGSDKGSDEPCTTGKSPDPQPINGVS